MQIKFRRGTADEWSTIDPILASGEPGHETDTGKYKVGDGLSAWSSLEYFLPQSILATMFRTVDEQGLDSDEIITALRSGGKVFGADLIEAADAAAARSAIDAFAPPAGIKVQVIQNFLVVAGLVRANDPNNELAVEFRGPVNPSAVMMNDDSWVIVE